MHQTYQEANKKEEYYYELDGTMAMILFLLIDNQGTENVFAEKKMFYIPVKKGLIVDLWTCKV